MKKSSIVFMLSVFLCSMLYAGSLYHNALSASKNADSFLVVKINEQRQIVAQHHVIFAFIEIKVHVEHSGNVGHKRHDTCQCFQVNVEYF